MMWRKKWRRASENKLAAIRILSLPSLRMLRLVRDLHNQMINLYNRTKRKFQLHSLNLQNEMENQPALFCNVCNNLLRKIKFQVRILLLNKNKADHQLENQSALK